MADRTLTSANSAIVMSFEGLYTAVPVQGFQANNMWSTEAISNLYTEMGVDGQLSVGSSPKSVPFNIYLQSTSQSIDMFSDVLQRQFANRTQYKASGFINIPSLGKSVRLVKGYLTNGMLFPNATDRLNGLTYGMIFETVNLIPLAV